MKAPALPETAPFKKGRCGFEFKDGKLYEFTSRHVLVMRPWPEPMAWYKQGRHPWRTTRKLADEVASRPFLFSGGPPRPPPRALARSADGSPAEIQDPLSAWYERSDEKALQALQSFVQAIPPEIRADLARYRTRRWHLLNVLARCPGAIDLSRSCPALLYALASNWVFHKPAVAKPIRAARNLVNRKQRVALEWLGFPGTEAVRRVLGKIRPEGLTLRRLIYLRAALADPECVKMLGHLPMIGETVLELATPFRLRPHVTPRLLDDVVVGEWRELSTLGTTTFPRLVAELVHDTVGMCEAVRWVRCPTRFASLAAVERLHDALIPRMGGVFWPRRGALPKRLPAPPFAGTEAIVPLTTVEALVVEGQEQRNCCAVRAPRVAQGCQYLYSVKAPVRGTLSVHFNGIRWEPGELRLACNQPVPDSVKTAVFSVLFQSGPCEDSFAFPNPEDSAEESLLVEEGEDAVPF